MRRSRSLVFSILMLSLAASAAARQPASAEGFSANSAVHFPEPASLSARVAFWEKIFTRFSEYQVVIHDAAQPERIFSVLDFRPKREEMSEAALERLITVRVSAEKDLVSKRLRQIASEGTLGREARQEEERVRSLFPPGTRPASFKAAAGRVRAQRGLREKFSAGLERAKMYLPEMRRILRDQGVPEQLVWLPLIESAFNPAAHSRAGAAGIWQFMPATGRQFMVVGESIDERWDPIASTEAAAKLLRQNFEVLKTWPLAITAYNHGRAGMLRAVAATRTRDIEVIIERYRGPLFGFASQNFYPEFLAALHVQRDYRVHFAGFSFEIPSRPDRVTLKHAIRVSDAVRLSGVAAEELAQLNPALRRPLFRADGWIPAGYGLWLPAGRGPQFEAGLTKLPSEKRRSYPSLASLRKSHAVGHRLHRVQPGQTLGQIARLYGISVAKIRERNGIKNIHRIREGQLLKIPTG